MCRPHLTPNLSEPTTQLFSFGGGRFGSPLSLMRSLRCLCCLPAPTDDGPAPPKAGDGSGAGVGLRTTPAADVQSSSDASSEERAAALRIQTLYRSKQARQTLECRRLEVQMTGEARVRTKSVRAKEVVTRVNDYSVGAELGRGAYGVVFKAKQGRQEDVAIKVLKRSVLKRIRQGKGTAYDGVLREILIMKRLNHPNVVRLYEVIDDPERDEMYLVMEFVTGGDLSEPITNKRASSEETLRGWLRDIVLGLEHLHHSGVCHRDLKPENVLWDAKGKRVKLADFGVSSICGEGRAGDYVRGSQGTPGFFAPEMCGDDKTGARAYSGKAADCWALGVCLYMWMYFRPPFEAPTLHMLLEEIREKEPPYDSRAYAASAELMALLQGLLARKPTQRLRLKDLRRASFLTLGGTEPLPPSTVLTAGEVAKEELRGAISTVVAQLRGGSMGENSVALRQTAEASDERAQDLAGSAVRKHGQDADRPTSLSDVSVALPADAPEARDLQAPPKALEC